MIVPIIFIDKAFTCFSHLWGTDNGTRYLVVTTKKRDRTEDHLILWDLNRVEQVIEKGVRLLVEVGVVVVHQTTTIII